MKVKGREQTVLSDGTEMSVKMGLVTWVKEEREVEARVGQEHLLSNYYVPGIVRYRGV